MCRLAVVGGKGAALLPRCRAAAQGRPRRRLTRCGSPPPRRRRCRTPHWTAGAGCARRCLPRGRNRPRPAWRARWSWPGRCLPRCWIGRGAPARGGSNTAVMKGHFTLIRTRALHRLQHAQPQSGVRLAPREPAAAPAGAAGQGEQRARGGAVARGTLLLHIHLPAGRPPHLVCHGEAAQRGVEVGGGAVANEDGGGGGGPARHVDAHAGGGGGHLGGRTGANSKGRGCWEARRGMGQGGGACADRRQGRQQRGSKEHARGGARCAACCAARGATRRGAGRRVVGVFQPSLPPPLRQH